MADPVSVPDVRAPDPVQRIVGFVPGLAAAGLGRTRDEVVSIWRDARQVAHKGTEQGGDASGPPKADHVYFAWYAGLGGMAALRFIEWRLAAVIAAAHTVERYGHRQRVREFVEGLDEGI